MDAAWLAAFLTAINAADDEPSDGEILTAQRLSTMTVEQVMTLGRKRGASLFRYAKRGYPDNPMAKDMFGYPKFRKNRYNQMGLKEALELSYTLANDPVHSAVLIPKGFTQARIDKLHTISENLETNNNTQEVKKTTRPVTTQERRIKMNTVWDYRVEVADASKEVYEDDYAKQHQYLLYPEHGNDTGSTAAGALNSAEHKVAFTGSILKASSTFDGKNATGQSYYLYSCANANDPFTGNGFYFQDGGQHDGITWGMIGGVNTFVKVYNPNGFPVDYEVTVV